MLLLEQLVILTSRQNIVCNEDRVTATVHKTRLGLKIHNDVAYDFIKTVTRAVNALHRTPKLLQSCFGTRHKSARFCIKPRINLILRADFLRNITILIAQIQNNAVGNTFIELIGMDIATKHFDTGSLILLQKRCSGKAHENSIGHNRFHCQVQLTGLCTVALVNKYENIIFGFEIGRQGSFQFLYVSLIVLLGCLTTTLAKLMNQRAEQAILVRIQSSQQIRATSGTNNSFIYAFEILFNLLVEFVTVCNDQYTCGRNVGKKPFG